MHRYDHDNLTTQRRAASPGAAVGPRARRGMVLILVLVVVVLLALAAGNFAGLMINERSAVEISSRQIQARMQVDSGVELMRVFLMGTLEDRSSMGGIYDNPARFRGQLVTDAIESTRRGRVTLVSTALDENGELAGLRYGLSDESARLNLNALVVIEQQVEGAGRQLLMTLPGMTEEIADAILDWIDEDDEPREFGAEIEYYSALEPPYAPRNGPLETVEELLLVRGVTPDLLFGRDANRNGVLDLHEQQTTGSLLDSTGGQLAGQTGGQTGGAITTGTGAANEFAPDLGWAAYLTLYSMEGNLAPDGLPRIDLNQADLNQLYAELSDALPPDWASFIVCYRLAGPFTGSQMGERGVTQIPPITGAGRGKIAQILDLIGAKVRVRIEGFDQPLVVASPFEDNPIAMGVYLPTLMDLCTVNPAPTIPGRININQAPRQLLLGVPGITEEIVTEILSRRSPEPTSEQPARRFETWLLSEGIVTTAEMRQLMPFICGGGDVHRAQVIGYFDGGGPSTRAEVVIDATGTFPRVLFWRDLSLLGRGFDLETLGIEVMLQEILPGSSPATPSSQLPLP